MKKYLVILLCLATQFVRAQQNATESKAKKLTISDNENKFSNASFSKWSMGLGLGGTYTVFDIEQDVVNPAVALNVKYSFGHVIGLRFQGMYASYSGKGTTSPKSEYGFVNNMTQLGLHLMVNVGGLNFRKKNPNTIVYLFSGASIAISDAKRDKKESQILAQLPGQKIISPNSGSYSGVDFTIPLGLGTKYKINDKFDIGLEGVVNIAKTDKFDIYEPFVNQGFPDFFGSMMVNVGYNFTSGKNAKHMDWVNPMAIIYDDLAKKAQKSVEAAKSDGDKDGIPDYLDMEPNTKLGYKVDVKGITLDSDVDGVPDSEDTDPYGFNQMLSVYYPAESFQVKSSVNVMRFSDSIPEADFITLTTEGYGLPVITFAPNKYDIHVEQYPLLQQIARIMAIDSNVMVAVIGHADENKPDMTQFNVAEKRALAVKRQLTKIYEIKEDRILVFSERDAFVKKYKMQTEGLDRKVEFRLIRKP